MNGFCIQTLGCRLNQAESGEMQRQLEQSGWRWEADLERADLILLNSCTVTARAESRMMQQVRRMRRRNPLARILVLGCISAEASEQLRAQQCVEVLPGTDAKEQIALLADDSRAASVPSAALQPAASRNEARANLKVQDGCDNQCSYCLVRVARGVSRSVPLDEVVRAADALSREYPEIVLAGVHLGSWGADLPGKPGLHHLVERLLELPHLGRLRLSSLDPSELSAGLLGLLGHPRLCRHLHLPLQSASPAVLQGMNRQEDLEHVRELLGTIRRDYPALRIGTDIIAGFPGETEAEFERSFERLHEMPLDYLHVFPYSERRGTAAARMTDRVPPDERQRRAARLREFSAERSAQFARSQLGAILEVVPERASNFCAGVSDNFLHLQFDRPASTPLASVRVLHVEPDALRGQLISQGGCA